MRLYKFLTFIAVSLATALLPHLALARSGDLETSFGFSFNRTQYEGGSFNWTRRWGASIGYSFNDTSELEASFQDVYNRNKFIGFEDATYHDQIYSANWVQSLLGPGYSLQPYIKGGIGQLNRRAMVSNSSGITKSSSIGQLTGVLGAGFKYHFTRTFAIRVEATSYLTGGRISTFKDNVAVQVGGSITF
jgi:hypothetical protein